MKKITIDLSDDQAWVFANFLKRTDVEDCREKAQNYENAHVMFDAITIVQDALAKMIRLI